MGKKSQNENLEWLLLYLNKISYKIMKIKLIVE